MIVRPAEHKDCGAIVELLRLSHENAGYEFPFMEPVAARLFRDHATEGYACCFVLGDKPKGVLMARVMNHPFGAGLYAKETLWFVHPSARGKYAVKMLREYETWARSKGCRFVGMASLQGSDLNSFYSRMGYKPVETHFVKAV